jgi:hypothetical protein
MLSLDPPACRKARAFPASDRSAVRSIRDVLDLGIRELQRYLVDKIHEVYRSQSVAINKQRIASSVVRCCGESA